MKLAVIGANGQLGTDLMEVFSAEHEVTGLNHGDIEITDIDSVGAALGEPKAVRHFMSAAESDDGTIAASSPLATASASQPRNRPVRLVMMAHLQMS